MTTIIRYNGSRFAGSSHASIDALLALLEVEPLDYEMFNCFMSITPKGLVVIHGNFLRVSHAFCIETDDKNILMSFQAAFDINYKLAKNRTYVKYKPEEAMIYMRDMSIKNDQLNKPL